MLEALVKKQTLADVRLHTHAAHLCEMCQARYTGDEKITQLPEVLFVEELSKLIGKSLTTIRTCSSNPKFHHLIPRPRKLPGSRRLCWFASDVADWLNASRPAEPPPVRRPRGRPTKAEQLSRLRWAEGQLSAEKLGV